MGIIFLKFNNIDMNNKEKEDIGLDLTILLKSIISENTNSGDIANSAITFSIMILKKYPDN